MYSEKKKIHLWNNLLWDICRDLDDVPYGIPLCPKQKCCCKLKKSKEPYSVGEYKYCCLKCDFKITLTKTIEDMGLDFISVHNSLKYKEADIVNIDGELIRVQREEKKDSDYWVDVKISRNKKNELQLMVLAGSKKEKDKTQLFLDPQIERLSFDNNNDHPKAVFAKVLAIFKNSSTEITSEEK